MTTSTITAIAALTAAIGLAAAVGVLINRRSGVLRPTADTVFSSEIDTPELGLSHTGPTVLHFSAAWCGPCAAVRRVVDQVCGELPDVAHVEIDLDANPAAARQLSVLSLPTTFIFDADGRQRYRTAGVPRAADLRSALEPLLA
jgi:thiol-disulfide isomerase/thioredoxin